MEDDYVWNLVPIPKGSKLNLIDSQWVFKRKLTEDNKTKFKARLVIRSFKDQNKYNLSDV